MSSNCINCKWWFKATCNCKEFNNNISISENDTRYIDYIENGNFAESIRENIDIKELGKNYLKMLLDQDYLKKNKDIRKVNFESEEMEIFEYIENELYQSIQNYFSDGNGTNLIINNPSDFSCCYWE